MAEHGCLHKEILLKKEKEILDYLSTKGKRDSMAKVLRCGLVHVYQSHPCMLEGRLLLRGSLLSVPPRTATHCFQQRHMWFTGKEKKAAARRKCQFLGILFISKDESRYLSLQVLGLWGRRPKIRDFHICANTAEFFKATAKNGLVFLPAFSML